MSTCPKTRYLVGKLRTQAARARRWMMALRQEDDAAKRLERYAEDLERQADQIENSGEAPVD